LQNKEIVLYAGTHGYAHGMRGSCGPRKFLQGGAACHFVFVGDGSAKPATIRQSKELGIHNVSFLDPVASCAGEETFLDCPLRIVSLNESFDFPTYSCPVRA